jgi:hypothetical protein
MSKPMRSAIFYKFVEYECTDTWNRAVSIPEGVWPVLLASDVTVIAKNRVLNLSSQAFTSLKTSGKAIALNQ